MGILDCTFQKIFLQYRLLEKSNIQQNSMYFKKIKMRVLWLFEVGVMFVGGGTGSLSYLPPARTSQNSNI